ncbi:MAG: hypothetical protein ACYCXY_04530 [Acidimicrobiales bacterium]
MGTKSRERRRAEQAKRRHEPDPGTRAGRTTSRESSEDDGTDRVLADRLIAAGAHADRHGRGDGADLEDAVEDAVGKLFPGLVHNRLAATSEAGWVAGRAAADLADLAVGPSLTPR